MAEGDRHQDTETGETLLETATGEMVAAVEGLPGAVRETVTAVEAGVSGVISAGLDNMLIGKGLMDALAVPFDAMGLGEAANSLREGGQAFKSARDRIQPDLFKAQQIESPLSFGLGEMAGTYAPGGPVLQGTIGVLQGIGLGDTPGEQMTGATLGLAGGTVGAIAARRAGRVRNLNRMRGGTAAERARATAIETLDEMGVPLRETDIAVPGTAGEARAQTRDRMRQLLTPGDSARVKRDALNEVVTDTIMPGSAQNAIDTNWRNQLFDEVDRLYGGVRGMLPRVTAQTDRNDTTIIRMLSNTDDIRIDQKPMVLARAGQVASEYEAGRLTPERWQQLRSTLGKDARSAHRTGEWETAEAMYQVRQDLDDLVTGGSPEINAALNEANELFRFREVIDSRHVVNPELDINPTAFLRNMERMFPRVWRQGSANPEAARVMYTGVAAAQQFPDFRTSGTGEMMNAASMTKQLQQQARLAAGTRAEQAGGSIGRGTAKILTDAITDIPGQIMDSFSEAFGADDAQDDEKPAD